MRSGQSYGRHSGDPTYDLLDRRIGRAKIVSSDPAMFKPELPQGHGKQISWSRCSEPWLISVVSSTLSHEYGIVFRHPHLTDSSECLLSLNVKSTLNLISRTSCCAVSFRFLVTRYVYNRSDRGSTLCPACDHNCGRTPNEACHLREIFPTPIIS